MAEHIVGPVAELPPGSHRVVEIGRLKIGVFNVEGTYYALPNICPHQFGPVCEGGLNGTMICTLDTAWRQEWDGERRYLTCPWHGIEYDVTTGRSLARPKLHVRHYPVVVEDGLVKLTVRGSRFEVRGSGNEDEPLP